MRAALAWALVWCLAPLVLAGTAGAQGVDIPARPRDVVGQPLVAAPTMRDTRFKETVIYVARHDQQGAFGIVINRPQGVGPLAEVLRAYRLTGPATDARVTLYWGGPVEGGRGFVLHSTDYGMTGALMVAGNLAVSRIETMAVAIAEKRGPRSALMAYGYTAWGPGQLDREVAARDWYVVPQQEPLIFDARDANKWRQALEAYGLEL